MTGRRLRTNVAIAGILSVAPLVAGCVSAVDDTTAFGYGKSGPAVGSQSASETGKSAGPDAAAQTSGGKAATGAEKSVADAAKVEAPALAQVAAANKAILKPAAGGPALTDTNAAAIAAFAGSTVLASSQTDQPEASRRKQADQTMFASLYAQSNAKTPIRNTDVGKTHRVILQRQGAPTPADGSALPGVRNTASLFEIGQKASADYDADIIDEASGEEPTYQTASVSGLARLAPNGLLVQRPDVQTSCFQPELVSMIRAVETRFHTKIVVTSGYRSPSHNLRVNGAKRSMHLQCKAADIIVPGADKFAVANFVRSLPGRGGVGTYCHTVAVHVDTGAQRDWNWACRRNRQNDAAVLLASQKTVPRASDD